jgi:hypothetical protein
LWRAANYPPRHCVSSCVSNGCENGSFRVGPCHPVSPVTHEVDRYFTENKGLGLAPVTSEVAGSNQFLPAIIFNRLPKRGFRPSRFRQGQGERRDHKEDEESHAGGDRKPECRSHSPMSARLPAPLSHRLIGFALRKAGLGLQHAVVSVRPSIRPKGRVRTHFPDRLLRKCPHQAGVPIVCQLARNWQDSSILTGRMSTCKRMIQRSL